MGCRGPGRGSRGKHNGLTADIHSTLHQGPLLVEVFWKLGVSAGRKLSLGNECDVRKREANYELQLSLEHTGAGWSVKERLKNSPLLA